MKHSQARNGRTFIIHFEDGDIIHEKIYQFAFEKSIKATELIIIEGVDKGSKLVVEPEKGRTKPIIPIEHILDNMCEVRGTGTILSDEDGNPILPMHIACGRDKSTVTGCIQ